ADRLADNQCLIDKLPAALGVKEVQLFPAADYDGVIQGLLGGTLDVAGLGASGFAAVYLQDPEAVEPFLTNVQTDGSTGYYSIALALADSGITSIEQAKGKKLGWADPDSTSGYLVPKVTLPEAIGGADPEEFFETSFNGGHENNVLALLDGKIDVAVTWASGVGEFSEGYTSGNVRSMVDKGMLDMEDVTQVWQSPLIPNGPLVMRKDLPQEMKDKIVAFYTALPTEDYECFRAVENGDFTGYTPVTVDFYQPIIDARKSTIGG
ncbi:MAG TPA: phosphonate ABC transporter substrate-binding protein, partial [Devosia sp.]|nr:phosphonate ABC transporter substrate-binding protein [Devosia sp.]